MVPLAHGTLNMNSIQNFDAWNTQHMEWPEPRTYTAQGPHRTPNTNSTRTYGTQQSYPGAMFGHCLSLLRVLIPTVLLSPTRLVPRSLLGENPGGTPRNLQGITQALRKRPKQKQTHLYTSLPVPTHFSLHILLHIF